MVKGVPIPTSGSKYILHTDMGPLGIGSGLRL